MDSPGGKATAKVGEAWDKMRDKFAFASGERKKFSGNEKEG